ncbi:MAG: neutral zinc metallopeptidase [Rubrivivax sp.]|nr:neutral zinc metallopeptidase [Rubrivivax sp.]
MKWEGERQSENVEDRRGMGGGGPRLIGGRGIGVGTIVVALVAGWMFGINPLTVLGLLSGGGDMAPQAQQQPARKPPAEDRQAAFVSTVLADTEDVWGRVLSASNARYDAPRLVLYSGRTPTACGGGDAAMGPFYCPGDRKVYLDLDFFRTLQANLGAPGDFAQAYVIAHEVGHHLQQLMGVTEKVDRMRGRLSEADMNRVSVRVELQADCLAGVWTHHSQKGKGWLEQNDIPEALNAASKIGDDTLQRQARGTVVPDSFTHGSSEQRVRWFKRGLEAGQVKACDTFSERTL